MCVFLRYRMTVARAERGGQCTCRPCRGRSRAAGRGEVAVVPHSSVLLSRCMGSQAAPRLVLYLLFSCLALQRGGPCWPGLGGFAGSGVGLISSGGPSKAWSPPPGVLWAAAHSPHWSGSLPSPLSTACISVAWFYLRAGLGPLLCSYFLKLGSSLAWPLPSPPPLSGQKTGFMDTLPQSWLSQLLMTQWNQQ